jgi:1-acyl-sn-glycerol-3-phosphate acyltransferase
VTDRKPNARKLTSVEYETSSPFFTTAVKRVWYDFVRGAITWFCRLFWRSTVEGSDHIPATGAFILAPVHRSNIDTPVLCQVTGRRVRYMGKDAMWKYGFSAFFFNSLGGFPVHRGEPDRKALRTSEEILRSGEPLVMFPEGTRQEGPIVEHVFDGVAYVALRTGVPIVPVGIGGSANGMPKGAKMIHPAKIHLVVGPPIEVEAPPAGERVPRRAVHELTERLQAELQVLFDEAQAKAGA